MSQAQAPIDDRQTSTHHVRSKVILAHVSWLLQTRGMKEIGDVEVNEKGYKQRFRTRGNVPIEVFVTPTEPADIRVEFHTHPRQHYRVATVGEDGKTMDISVMCERIAGGVHQIASSFQEDEKFVPVDPNVVHRSDVRIRSDRTSRSKEVETRPDTGNVTHQVRERSQENPVDKKTKNELETDEIELQKRPPQITAQLTSMWVRCARVPELEPAQPLIQKAIEASKASMEDLPQRLAKIRSWIEKQSEKSHRFERISRGMSRDLASVVRMTASSQDKRTRGTEDDGEKNTALDRLRAVVKPESQVLPTPYRGGMAGLHARKFIGTRNRGAVKESALPDEDDLHDTLKADRQADFTQLIVKAMRELYGKKPRVTYSPSLKAWSVADEDWSGTIRTERRPGGQVVGWAVFGTKKGGQVRKHASEKIVGNAYDGLALNIAVWLGDWLIRTGIVKKNVRS